MLHKLRKVDTRSVLDLYNMLLAVVLLLVPWFLVHASERATLDLRVSAAAIICLSLASIVTFSYWEEWAILALGLWLVVSPWLLGFAHTHAMHFGIGIGAVIAYFAALELWLRYDATESQATASNAMTSASKNPAG
jgi:hypothetical protein